MHERAPGVDDVERSREQVAVEDPADLLEQAGGLGPARRSQRGPVLVEEVVFRMRTSPPRLLHDDYWLA